MSQLPVTQVFMSYSRRDKDAMWRTVIFLRKQGINVWVDNEKLIPGTPVWEEEIEKAIKAARVIVVVMSPDSKASEWVRREISLADQEHKHILPILVRGDEDSSITLRLVTRQYIDMRQNEEAGLNSLYRALSQYLNEIEAQSLEMAEKETKQEVPERTVPEKVAVNGASGFEIGIAPDSRTISQILPWFTLAWAIGGLVSGFIYNSSYAEFIGEAIGGVIGGAIGGLVTSLTVRNEKVPFDQKNIARNTFAWAISGAIGWLIGWGMLTEAVGAGIGMTIFAIGGLASTLGVNYVISHWKSSAAIILTWAVGGAIGWSIARGLIYDLGIDNATGWSIGIAIGWGIGGFVMGWQLLKNKGNS